MKRIALSVTMLALCACTPAAPPEGAQAAVPPTIVSASCDGDASRDWSAVGSQYYVIEAAAHGPTCAEAIATLRIRSVEGAVLFTRDYLVRETTLAFNPGNGQTGLRSDLEAWTQNVSETQAADSLPAWPAGVAAPPGFQPAVPRAVYERVRGDQSALFCFPDGAASTACVALAGDTATFLGSLAFEG